MSKDRSAYCRLEIYCALNILSYAQSNSYVEKSFRDGEIEVYVENYSKFPSVKERIIELTNIWLDKYPEEKIYWNEDVDKNIKNKHSCSLRFLIFNRWKKMMPIGITYKGWYVSYLFYGYSAKYVEDKYGKDKVDEIVWREKFGFMAPEHTEVNELDLVSEKTAELFVTEWLDKGDVSEDFMEKIFTEELENREFF